MGSRRVKAARGRTSWLKKIGELTMERDFLSKGAASLSLSVRRQKLNPDGAALDPAAVQAAVAGIARRRINLRQPQDGRAATRTRP
jgi:hypothetical protein